MSRVALLLSALAVLTLATGCCCKTPCCDPMNDVGVDLTPIEETAQDPDVVGEFKDAEGPVVESHAVRVHRVLNTKRVKGLVWKDTTLDQAVAYMRTISGVSFYLTPTVTKEYVQTGKVKLNAELDDVTLRDVLKVVMTEPWGLTYEVKLKGVAILTQEEADSQLRLRYYDVKDLVGSAIAWDELEVRIRNNVTPKLWDRDDATMEHRNGILIVRAPRRTLQGIDEVLTRMRRIEKR